MNDAEELLERFRRGPELVASALTGAAGSEVDFRPGPGEWSVRQIVAHLADSEIVGAERFRRVVAEDNPTLLAFDESAWAERLDYQRRKPSASLETFRRTRAENYELLKDLSPESFERRGNHTELGPVSLLGLLKTYAEHAESHTQQIFRVREQFKRTKSAGA
jgi:hypothetical protein